MRFQARHFTFNFPRPALVMGIVNVTPDSFSDGGRFLSAEAAIEQGLKLIAEGADILDIGGESTRPGAESISVEEELLRIIPVVEALSSKISIPISVDTSKIEVARAALGKGAAIINDIAANREDDAMWRLIAESGAGYICMHMQGTPQTMQQGPVYGDVVAAVNSFFGERLSRLSGCGVKAEQIVLDVGIGFGKTAGHNLELLRGLRSFAKWERPMLLGVSRKSFLGKLVGGDVLERLPPSIACACWAVQNGTQIIRTHDVVATKQAVRMTEMLISRGE
jgi:dihydropteroate synthase